MAFSGDFLSYYFVAFGGYRFFDLTQVNKFAVQMKHRRSLFVADIGALHFREALRAFAHSRFTMRTHHSAYIYGVRSVCDNTRGYADRFRDCIFAGSVVLCEIGSE